MKKFLKSVFAPRKAESVDDLESIRLLVERKSTRGSFDKNLIGIHKSCVVIRSDVAKELGIDETCTASIALHNSKLSIIWKIGMDSQLFKMRKADTGYLYLNADKKALSALKQFHGQYRPEEPIQEGPYFVAELNQVRI